MAKRILVVDDEPSIVTLLTYNLEQAGYKVVSENDGRAGFDRAKSETFDMMVLDLMLPNMDGIDVCKQLRQEKVFTPILMLTAKDEDFDKVLGLELGADDYMTKPFSPREVVARVRAILRRVDHEQAGERSEEEDEKKHFAIGKLMIYPDHYEVYQRDKRLTFTPKEFELLTFLASNKGRVLTRDQLLNAVWDYEFVGDTRIVDVHISHLREKIERDSKKPVYIKTIRGLGYKLEEPRTDE
ncbi:response regulator transcription factor [Shouchella lonarensis]|uniref:Two-component system, OmpR family, alkaline phosphatase synthesis response regulator PhoP n=1 Tax=Shouchella lonarensis TaxID=1464122 RepID=A0A1G6GNW4_9BACI|nr:response regulator transcription factor [Shouchella lonarensis]SDB83619.1 two-component system, OmpR family, alkaline phosphatase synthesis response regulator PhoP [Shouchella lonarensis]